MNIGLAIFIGVLVFGVCCLFASTVYYQNAVDLQEKNHVRELAAFKKVGSWYEGRVKELEAENRSLALQIVEGLGRPAIAMPQWPDTPQDEYAFDQTGLVMSRLDPSEVT